MIVVILNLDDGRHQRCESGVSRVTDVSYERERTGLVLIDPYNEFLGEGGQVWQLVRQVAESVDLHQHLRDVLGAVRAAGIQVFVAPHRRRRPGDFDGWKHLTAGQRAIRNGGPLQDGSWGAQWHAEFGPGPGDVVAHEHWVSGGFANTDLDFQLRQRGVEKIILVGLVAHTCVESTGRFGAELGYHVTLVKDATAAGSAEAMHAAHTITGPTYAHSIVTAAQLLAALPTG
jgi:nicotinamidase-related amidase